LSAVNYVLSSTKNGFGDFFTNSSGHTVSEAIEKNVGEKEVTGVRFFGIYTLQCCCHNLKCIVIVCTREKEIRIKSFEKYVEKVSDKCIGEDNGKYLVLSDWQKNHY
jgi:hypothetical protein